MPEIAPRVDAATAARPPVAPRRPARRPRFPLDAGDPTRVDAQRVAGYLAGDAGAFAEVDSWIRGDLLKRFSSLRNEEEDIRQSVHWRLVIKLREGAFAYRSTLRSYVSGITYHLAIDRLRESYRDRTVPASREPEDRTSETSYRSLAPAESARLLDQVLAQARPGCRALWRMVFVEHLTYAEAARRLSIPQGTVKSRVWHGRQRALAFLEQRA